MAIKKYKIRDGLFIETQINVTGADVGPELKKMFTRLRQEPEPTMKDYEIMAAEILMSQRFPTTLAGLWPLKDKDLPSQVRDIKSMLLSFKIVREQIKKGHAAPAAYNMSIAIEAAMRALIRPIEPHAFRGAKIIKNVRAGGYARAEVKREEHEKIQQRANAVWEDHPLWSKRRMAIKLASEFNLKIDTISRIIKKN